MELKLSVPSLSTRLLNDVEMSPEKVEKWLADLPLLNIVDTSRKLLSTLTVYNRIQLKNKLRLQLLELYRDPVSQVCLELKKHYMGLPVPLSEKYKNISEKSQRFQVEMAFGYKRIVLHTEQPYKSKNEDEQKANTALPIQRAIRYLAEVMAISYRSYSTYLQGVWQEIHTLYKHAEAQGVAEVAVEDPFNTAQKQSSVSHVYKQALLLDLSDPLHLPPRMVDKTQHYLDRWAPLAQLTAAAADFDPTCQFLIDQNSDRAGILYTEGTTLDEPKRYRLLNTVELARQIHTQLTSIQKGLEPEAEGLDEKLFKKKSGEDMLLRLINAWGINPKRHFQRAAKSAAQIDVAIGIDAINYWVNDGKKFATSSSFVGPLSQRTAVGAFEHVQREQEIPELKYSSWNIRDESADGLALVKNGLIKDRVRVGDLVATKASEKAKGWEIGVVRWVKSASPSHVDIGTQRLSPNAEPVVIKTFNEKNQESDFLPALLLPENEALKQKQALITHRNVFRSNRLIYMDNGCRLYKITTTELIEHSGSFERFTFTIENS